MESSQEYRKHIIETIKETYPKYLQKKLLKEIIARGKAVTEKNLFSEIPNVTDLSEINEDMQLITAIDGNNDVIKILEEDEFTRAYTYSVLFSIENVPSEFYKYLSKSKKIKTFSIDDFDYDMLFKDRYDQIIPTLYSKNEVIMLKFSRLLSGYLPNSGEKRSVKFPIVVVIFEDFNILEIRFGKVKGFLRNNDEYFYRKQIDFILNWLQENLPCDIEPLNMSPIINHISKLEESHVSVSAQAMNLLGGGKAVLDTGVNDNYILPLLGELKELIKNNQETFDKNDETKKIKSILETFIMETEEMSDLPWMSLTWTNEPKTRATKVKFHFNYMNQEYSLLQYYYDTKTEMERMNNVTRYIIENKRELEQKENINTGT